MRDDGSLRAVASATPDEHILDARRRKVVHAAPMLLDREDKDADKDTNSSHSSSSGPTIKTKMKRIFIMSYKIIS